MKRIFLIVLDSVGIGAMPDASDYGDEGSNTLGACVKSSKFHAPNLEALGLFAIDGDNYKNEHTAPKVAVARMAEASKGKDTTIGHWEIAGIISENPLPTYPNGFPPEIIEELRRLTGRGILCNRPYSGTAVLEDYGEEHVKTGALIVYTSADSVLQIATHEAIVPVETLYQYCEMARGVLVGEHGVGRVIARPFVGDYPNYQRTSNRHDFSLNPPKQTMLDTLLDAGKEVIAVGKISDIFAGQGITKAIRTRGNEEGIAKTIEMTKEPFEGLCFVNLVDFDMMYGHRNDIDGYATALSYFDACLPDILAGMQKEDLLMVTADHGCDPSTTSTDHSREYTPLLIIGSQVTTKNLGTRNTFSDISATILDYFDVTQNGSGTSMLKDIL